MNYFAHGRDFTGDPYFLAGTAIPDWLSILDRQVRVRAKRAREFVEDPDPQVAALARGVVQHHADDDWFHQTAAFYELNVELARRVRECLAGQAGDDTFRPAFLGHILIELLLDAALIAEQPGLLDAYYAALSQVDPLLLEAGVNRMATRPTDRLAPLLPRFLSERFLYDYADDGKLLRRLNQVMRRVNLPPLPEQVLALLPAARRLISERKAELLTSTSH